MLAQWRVQEIQRGSQNFSSSNNQGNPAFYNKNVGVRVT